MNGRKTGTSRATGWPARPFRPVEQFAERRTQAVPDFLNRLDLETEGVGEGLLGQAGVDPDAQAAGGQLQQGEPARGIEMVEHRASTRGASSFDADRSRSIASVMGMVASSTSGGSPGRPGHNRETVSAESPT